MTSYACLMIPLDNPEFEKHIPDIYSAELQLIKQILHLWHAERGRLILRTPGLVPLGLAYVLLVETNAFPNLSLFFRTMLFEYPSVLSRFCFRQRNFFHGFKYKVFGSDIHTSVYDRRDDFGFLLVISHGWVVTSPDPHSTVFTFAVG